MDLKELKEVIATLHPLERKVLPILEHAHSLHEVMERTKLKDVEVMRAFQWLENKGIITTKEESKELVDLDENGLSYLENGLPEKRVLKALAKAEENKAAVRELVDEEVISEEETNISIGALKKKAAINVIKEDDELILIMTEAGKKLLEKDTLEERFLKKEFPIETKALDVEDKFAIDELKKRKNIIKVYIEKTKKVELTAKGKNILTLGIPKEDLIERVTPFLIKTKKWEGKNFRKYDVKLNVPEITGGRKQHYRAFLDEVRQKFLALGFTEMTGPIVETEFWDMDSLFMPQAHSARDIHGAYYIKEPKSASIHELPAEILDKVKQAHENGYKTGSKGWGYNFDYEKTRQLILRTQTTACSARTLASKELQVPGKYFAIARNFRPDVIDATHNCDFNQVEGIVVEEGLSIKHLFGLLKMFAKEFANTEEVKIVPGYYPFTEPSAVLYAKHPQLGWIELGGSGIFRPELTKPLGVKVPVIAWGIGIDRIAMFKLGLNDIRQLYSHDLKLLREIKVS